MQLSLKEHINERAGTPLGGALLIAGTCMGAGMLAIPIATGMSGFFRLSLSILCAGCSCWRRVCFF